MYSNIWGPFPTDWATLSVSEAQPYEAQVVCTPKSVIDTASKVFKLPTSLALRQRFVAQQRRRLETQEFGRLRATLPISRVLSEQHIDKTSVVRLAASYIRLRQLLVAEYAFQGPALISGDLLDGFLSLLTESGTILYVSESISLHLGLSQVDMIGNHLDGYLHPDDDVNQFIQTVLFNVDGSGVTTLRFKSTLAKWSSRGDVHRSNGGFKSFNVNAYVCRRSEHAASYLAIYCQPHLTALGSTLYLNNDTFVLITDLAFGIVYTDPRFYTFSNCNTFNSKTKDITVTKATTLYQWIHPDDGYVTADMHLKLFKYGSHYCPLLRFMNGSNQNVFCAEVFGLSFTAIQPHGNKQRVNSEHLIMVCTFVGWI